ncbi:MAG: hypothetical protein WC797_02360 [Candidatus Paceibacterota bacterium]|jgi:hypothetical protein
MATTVEVTRNKSETPSSLIRRFTKRVQESGSVKTAKGKRYTQRSRSEYTKKKMALARLDKRRNIEKLKKLGKISDVVRHHR